jgi:hypothetical protein
MTEQPMNDPETHAAKLAQISRNLRTVAEKLVAQNPDFPPADFGRAYFAVALALMLGATGDAATAAWLRQIADGLESGAAQAVN